MKLVLLMSLDMIEISFSPKLRDCFIQGVRKKPECILTNAFFTETTELILPKLYASDLLKFFKMLEDFLYWSEKQDGYHG